jgi:pimeloyl-ACP methyl ester carboxylesterase
VADAEAWLEHFELRPAIVIGQSLGGHTAFLLAAERPDLVQALVVVEATPEPGPDAPENIRRWLASWPVPFRSREAALTFFGGDTRWARAWVEGLEDTEQGLEPRFDIDVMLESLAETATNSYWNEWRSLKCPTLIVRGETGYLPREIALRMAELNPASEVAEITGAGHDLHLEQPEKWREAVEAFLRISPH